MLARRPPLSRRAHGGWARRTRLGRRASSPDVAADRVSPRWDVPVDATPWFPSVKHVTGVDVVVRLLPQLRSWARTVESVILARAPRRACAQQSRHRAQEGRRSRNAGAHGRTSGSRAAREAFAPRYARECEPLRVGRRDALRRRVRLRDETGRGPRVEESLPGRMGSSPARDRRALGVAGRCANDGLEPSLQIHRLDRRLACRRSPREGRAPHLRTRARFVTVIVHGRCGIAPDADP